MISDRGIKADLNKIIAIVDMSPPYTKIEIRGFLGRLQYISRFIVRLTNNCEPIFRLLRKKQPKVWDDQCQLAFDQIRDYFLSSPVSVPSMLERPLLLYFSISYIALGCMQAQLDDYSKLSII